MSASDAVWLEAFQRLDELERSAQVVQVLLAAERHGLLLELAAGTSVAALATRTALPLSRLEAVLVLLRAHGIAEERAGHWSLAPSWAALARGESPVELRALLGQGRVQREQSGRCLDPDLEDYWGLTAEDRLLVARGISFEPSSPAGQAMARGNVERVPGAVEALEQGGRLLELGCGVASRLSAVLLCFPRATAVGVELAEDLAVFGRERAEGLGLGHRLQVVVGDAGSYEPDGAFDLVGWSQFFFPEGARRPALATARRALRPGGWITMPVIWDGAPPEPGSAEDQRIAVERLALDLWHVPLRSVPEIVVELQDAGFVDVAVDEGPVVHLVRGRQPG
ncbi:MAG TPA: class I SAM-dependent methyltransferase [Mycobacteriales bacterium]|nr:class I SAM-dependent methyltransferase [Mycobacteriales bacterium]